MYNRRSHLTHALSTLVMGAALVLISSVGAQATDAIDDPVRQPHLKSWSNVIPNAAKRFIVLADFNNAAVLDRETGLVWEQAPDGTPDIWLNAISNCINKNVGGTWGWRLPSVVELKSLLDPSLPTPFVPLSIFTGVQANYWTASPSGGGNVWFLRVGSDGYAGQYNRIGPFHSWCVRAPMNGDVYY